MIVADDSEAESLTFELRLAGYTAVASIEHETRHRLSVVRLMLQFTPKLDMSRVREHFARITSRGYGLEQDLEAKLATVLNDVGYSKR